MARESDIQYIRFYTDGSAARQVAPKAPRRKPAAVRKPQKRPVVKIYPLAMSGIIVSAVMLVLMVVGLVQLRQTREEVTVLESYVSQLERENRSLQAEYTAGYDLEEVEKTALALGMVPMEEVEQITMRVEVPTQPQETGFWENIRTFLAGLFA